MDTAEEVEIVEHAPLPAVRAHEAMVAKAEVSVAEVVAQREKIEQVMAQVMQEGVHYGKVPGVSKPTLLKPGAEVLNVTFRFAPSYHSDRTFHEGGHLTVVSRCVLTHAPSGLVLGEGEGLCSTLESKYAYRSGKPQCPACGAEAIRKSKYPPRESDYPGASKSDPPGWYCNRREDGCGANFAASDERITSQSTGKVPNENLPDSWNTVLKMADKRALVAAVLNATAASDVFTQDVEETGAAAADTTEQVFGEPTKVVSGWVGPKDWGEIAQRLAFQVGEEEAQIWVSQAIHATYGDDSVRDLGQADRQSAGEGMAEVIRELEGIYRGQEDSVFPDAREFPPPSRDEVQKAFARAFDGVILDGPGWAMGDETDRPTKEELGAQEQQAALDEEALEQAEMFTGSDVDAEAIPFGEEETK